MRLVDCLKLIDSPGPHLDTTEPLNPIPTTTTAKIALAAKIFFLIFFSPHFKKIKIKLILFSTFNSLISSALNEREKIECFC